MSAYEGARLLRGAPGSKVSLLVIRGNAADPHVVDPRPRARGQRRSHVADGERAPPATSASPSSPGFPDPHEAGHRRAGKTGATRFVIDLRGTSRGDLDDGIAAARLFVKERYARRPPDARRHARNDCRAGAGDGAVTAPVALLVDQGTAGAAEVFAAALAGNDRADLVGTRTLGRAARQRLVKLPDQSGLWLTYVRYLTPTSNPIHETGLEPDVEVEQPEIEFGSQPPAPDAALQRALDHISAKK